VETNGNFITVKPKDDLVGKYISYYYFHSSNEKGFHKKFFFYPNYKHALTIYKDSDVSIDEKGTDVQPSSSKKYCAFYSVNADKNLSVSLNGIFDKIGIVFNPLGLNHFLDKPLNEVFNGPVSRFNYFGTALEEVSLRVCNEPDAEKKAALLDEFFIKQYSGFEDAVVKKSVQEILNSNGSVRVEELSLKLGVNRKTLLRLFKKHLQCSVEEYKKMVMFRNALNYSQEAEDITLTDVALYSLYYDQAHYIKHFKAVTQQSPKALLTKLTHLGTQDVYWHFED
jgi:AraC-like DNA-binding protein